MAIDKQAQQLHGTFMLAAHTGQQLGQVKPGHRRQRRLHLRGNPGHHWRRLGRLRLCGARGQPAPQGGIQGFGADRFGDEIAHPSLKAGLAVFGEGVGGHRQNGKFRLARQLANPACRGQTVKNGHLHVHQDQREVAALHFPHPGFAVIDRYGVQADIFQQRAGDFLIDRIVFANQHGRPLGILTQPDFIGHGRRQGQSFLRRRLTGSQHDIEPEGAALARHAAAPGTTAHEFSQLAGNCQPQPTTAIFAGGRAIGLFEGIENPFQHVRRDADTAVNH